MIQRKNRFILQIASVTLLISLLFHLLHRGLDAFSHSAMHGMHGMDFTGPEYSSRFGLLLNLILAIPIVTLAAGFALYLKNRAHPWIPLLNTVTLTFCSISTIAGGGGQVELHFSIFMVVAILAYYESVSLILVMTAIFTVQHLAGYLFRPEIVFGADSYSFQMVCIHAFFLVLTSGATILQIRSTVRIRQDIEKENREEKQAAVRDIVERLSAASSQIVHTAQELSGHSSRATETNHAMASRIQQIASRTENQVMESENSTRAMQEIAAGVTRIADSSAGVADTAAESAIQASAGNDSIRDISNQMANIERSVGQSDEAAQSLSERSQEIGVIAAAIKGIARQTDLLALNAAIEASRAGEQGRGFSIVASEVRKLAEQSREMAERIDELIFLMQSDSRSSVESIQRAKEDVMQGLAIVGAARESFESLLELSERVSEHVQDISAVAQQIAAGSQQVAASLGEMSGSAFDYAEQTRQLNAMTEEQLALMDSILQSARQLQASSGDLGLIMEKVKEE